MTRPSKNATLSSNHKKNIMHLKKLKIFCSAFLITAFVLISTKDLIAHPAPPVSPTPYSVAYKKILIDGINIFYREAGNPTAPTILLLHGFPSSSYMYRDLIN